jgi:hypothetical protein
MPSIREAIEALAVELEMGDVVASTFYVEGCNDEAQRIAVRLRAILAIPEPSRGELRAKIAWEIEKYCGDDDEGKGASKTWIQWKFDFADRILALFEPPDLTDATLPLMPTSKRTVVLREEPLREALRKIIEWCDGTRGADFGKAPFEAIGDCARAALSRSPSKPEELLREAFVEGAEWADMHDCGGISTEESQEAIRAAALRRHPLDWCERARESAPAKDGRIVGRCVHDYEPVTCDGECSTKCPFIVNGWLPNPAPAKPIEDRSHEIEFTDDEDRTPEQIALMADLTAKPAEPTLGFIHDADEYFGKELKVYPAPAKDAEPALGLNIVEDSYMPEDVIAAVTKDEQGNVTQRVFIKNVADPAAPQFLTMTQPKIDFVLDLSQAEADRLGPPAPKVWRCVGCGKVFENPVFINGGDDGKGKHWTREGVFCGPVEVKK